MAYQRKTVEVDDIYYFLLTLNIFKTDLIKKKK